MLWSKKRRERPTKAGDSTAKENGQTQGIVRDDQPFREQDNAASQFELQSPLKADALHPYDSEPNAFPIFEKTPLLTADQPNHSLDHDRLVAKFQQGSPLSAGSTAFANEDQYATIFCDKVALKDDVIGTTLASVHTKPLKEPEATRTTYYIYHRNGRKHFKLSPNPDPDLEKMFPSMKTLRRKRKEERAYDKARAEGGDKAMDDDEEEDGYFVHMPYIGCHHPPRTLRRGTHKSGTPFCLIYNSSFWRKWKLLLGDDLSEPGVIDARGVVSYQHHKPRRERGELDLQGYKVTRRRMWGQSGKAYVRQVNAERKAAKFAEHLHDHVRRHEHSNLGQHAKAEEAVYLNWTSPFSPNTRRYHFQYAGVDFYWKGTGTVKETRRCGFCNRYNHLKLVARVPISEYEPSPPWLIRTETKVLLGPRRVKGGPRRVDGTSTREITLAKYTSSVAARKAGMLELYDEAIYRFVQEFIVQRGNECSGTVLGREVQSVKRTRLYDLLVATAMCMVIAEWEKRETIRQIIQALAAAGGSG